MTNIEQIKLIADTVHKEHDGKIMFDSPITIKQNPHSFPIHLYGIEIESISGVWLMDSNQEWHKLEDTDRNFSIVANSIIQRLKLLANAKN